MGSIMQQHLLNISQRLSVNTDMGDGSITDDELLLKKQYEEYHEPVIKTFSVASESPFFKLLLEHLKEGLEKLPGWSGWILLEYYDDAVNGLRLVLITDENSYSIKANDIRGLDQENYNFSLLIRAMREFHVHVNGWHFKTTNCDPIYHCENKLSLNIMLPDKSNPYSEKPEQDQHYNAYARPILISQAEKASETINHITQNDDQFLFNSALGDYFQMIEQCRKNANAFTNENNQNNQLLNDHQIARGLMEEFDCDDLERIAGKTTKFLIEDLNQKLDRNIEKILIDKGKIKILTRKSFEEYCQRLAKCFTDSNQFLYLPAFTTLKKGEDKLPQRKDLLIGSILIGVDKDNSFNTDQIHHLWRFVQSELLKWYNQYNSFKLYTSNKRMKQEALLNAITQVFARNESHINGSHVIAHYLKNKEDFANHEKKYLEYLQQRMELVASVQQYPGFLKGIFTLDEIRKEIKCNAVLKKGIADGTGTGFLSKSESGSENKQIALPGHNLGKQLLLVFLEGMFRNCKKHGKIDSTIQLIYNISEPKDDTLKEKYYVLDVWDKLDGNNINVEKINQLLTQPVIKDNRLRPGSWGMLELKAAAALLIDFPLIHIDSLNDNTIKKKKDGANPETLVANGKTYPVFIRAYLYKDDGTIVENHDASPKHLGYRLYLLKPKLVFTNNKDFYDKASESDKELLIYKPKFSSTEASDFFLSDNSDKTTHNYREISINGFNAGSDSIKNELWKEYTKQKNWDDLKLLLISYNETKSNYKINGKDYQTVPDVHDKIIFDYHGNWYKNIGDEKKSSLKSKAYYCLYSGNNDGINDSFYFESDEQKYKYLEMANTKVSIIDERVQKNIWEAKPDNNSGMNMMEAYKRMDILIPDKENGLDLDKYDSDKVHEYLKDRLNECRYTILHHGIFEALCKRENTDKYDQDNINNFYHTLHRPAENHFLVLMSGSGVPSSLPNNGYFLNLSSLQLVMETKSKLRLVQLLHALRPMK